MEVGHSTGRREEQESKRHRVRHVVREGRSGERSEARACQDGTDTCAQALPFGLRHSFFFKRTHHGNQIIHRDIYGAREGNNNGET